MDQYSPECPHCNWIIDRKDLITERVNSIIRAFPNKYVIGFLTKTHKNSDDDLFPLIKDILDFVSELQQKGFQNAQIVISRNKKRSNEHLSAKIGFGCDKDKFNSHFGANDGVISNFRDVVRVCFIPPPNDTIIVIEGNELGSFLDSSRGFWSVINNYYFHIMKKEFDKNTSQMYLFISVWKNVIKKITISFGTRIVV